MGNLKNCDKLIDKIDQELSWRKQELTQIKFIVKTAPDDSELTILRSSIVLLYSHWEGFVKRALTLYLQHIADQKLHSNELKPNFYAMGLKNDLEKFRKTKRFSHCISITQEILDKIFAIPNIPYGEIIDTESNLNSELFVELMTSVGLDPSIHDTTFNLIDERLLARRNGIAHGEHRKRFPMTKDEYFEIHDKIIIIFDSIAEQIIDSAFNKKYMNTMENTTNRENNKVLVTIG